MSAARIAVPYGRYDLVATAPTTEACARTWVMTRLHPYDRGHAPRRMYEDYPRLLDEELRAFDR
jgi:hypothetical protein